VKFKPSQETEEATEKRELVKKLLERRYGPFPGAGGAGRILYEGALKLQSLEILRSMEKSASLYEIHCRERKNRR
jgi:hypothetical protein